MGQMIRVRVDWVLASELSWSGMESTYDDIGRPALLRPDRFWRQSTPPRERWKLLIHSPLQLRPITSLTPVSTLIPKSRCAALPVRLLLRERSPNDC